MSLDLLIGGVEALAGGGVLAYGASAVGLIADDRYEAIYTFTGERGDVVTITLSRRSGDLDAFLILQDAQGNQLAANDDAPGAATATDSRIAHFRLPADGTYTIVATRFQRQAGTSRGQFELTLELAAPESARRLSVPLVAGMSGAVSDDGHIYRQIFPGDDARGASYQGFVTFALPMEVTPASLLWAELLLGECTVHDDPFVDLGPLGVEPFAYGALDAADFGLPDPGRQVGIVSACPAEPLVVTEAALTALGRGDRQVQFRLTFPRGADADGAIDDVTFSDPQLILELPAL